MKYPTHPKGGPARGMCGIFHEGCFPSLISQGNGVILRVFLYWLVYFTCICRIDEKLVTQRKLIFNPRKAPKRLCRKNWEAFANEKFWSPQKGRNELRIVYSAGAIKPPTRKPHSSLWGWIVPNERLLEIDVIQSRLKMYPKPEKCAQKL